MHRSSSNTRVSDEFLKYSSSAPSQGSNRCSIDNVNGSSSNQLPVYNPISPSAKKEKSRLRSAENAIHVIPLVLLLCAIILWFCSNPDNFEVCHQYPRLNQALSHRSQWIPHVHSIFPSVGSINGGAQEPATLFTISIYYHWSFFSPFYQPTKL